MKQNKDKTVVLPLSGEFKGVVLKRSGGLITMSVSSLAEVDGVLLTDEHDKVIQIVPIPSQKESENIEHHTPTAESFDPANQMVPVGEVRLNQVSAYLADVPDTVRAKFLLAPRDLANFYGGKRGTFFENIQRIRRLNEDHGIHYVDKALKGIPLYDRRKNMGFITYEKMLAQALREAWKKANRNGKSELTGLAMPTKQMVDGCAGDTRMVTFKSNICSQVFGINAKLRAQKSEIIKIDSRLGPEALQMTCTENPYRQAEVFGVQLSRQEKEVFTLHKGMGEALVRPFAMLIYPS